MNDDLNSVPYFYNEKGTRVFGSKRPGYSAWRLFDQKLFEHLSERYSESRSDDVPMLTTSKLNLIGIFAFPAVFVLYIILRFIIDFNFILSVFLCFIALFFSIRLISKMKKRLKEEERSLNEGFRDNGPAEAEYVRIAEEARKGNVSKELPSNIRSWALGALGENQVGERLESLGPNYEVSHDLTILDPFGNEVSNIDHIVSTPAGVIMVDAKRWSGKTTVDSASGEITSASQFNDEYRRKAIHSLRREAESFGFPVRAVVVAVVGGKVEGIYNGQTVNGIARILDDTTFDTYIMEEELIEEFMGKISFEGFETVPLIDIASAIQQNGYRVVF